MDSSDRVIDESTGNAPPREDDSRRSALFNVVVVVLGVALALTILLVASFEVWVFGLWFGSGETWTGFPWILVVPPIVGLLALCALFALWMRWAVQRPWAWTARRQPGLEAHPRTRPREATDRSAISAEHYQASPEQRLANLLQRRRMRAITETEYQTQLLEVRRLVSRRAEGTTDDEE